MDTFETTSLAWRQSQVHLSHEVISLPVTVETMDALDGRTIHIPQNIKHEVPR